MPPLTAGIVESFASGLLGIPLAFILMSWFLKYAYILFDHIVRGYFHERDDMEPVTRKELLSRMKKGLVQVLDVRPEDEFALGHVPGAINIPLDQLKKRMATLDPRKEIVAYCRGPYCVLSFETVAILRKKGFTVRRLEDGMPEWRAAGLPVDISSG